MTLRYALLARRRLAAITDYYVDIDAAAAGLRITSELRARAEGLIAQPGRGFPDQVLAHRSREYRSLVAKGSPYKIVYVVEGDVVTVVTVFDMRRDPGRLLEEVPE